MDILEKVLLDDLLLVNVGDLGEEIDDEVNSLLLSHLNVEVVTLLVNGKMSSEKRLDRCKELGIDQIVPMAGIEDWKDTILASTGKFKRIVVQQNAPIRRDDSHHAVAITNWLNHLASKDGVDIVYIAQGTFGKCMNTGGDALEGALLLSSAARVRLCVDSASNMAFTYNFYKSPHLSTKTKLKKAIATLFVKNTLGRAPANGYCRHLVGKGGANFETSHELWDVLKPTLNEHVQYRWEDLHLHPSFPLAMKTATKYCDPANPENLNLPDVEAFARMKLEDIGQTREDQIHGLARMMTAFHVLFGTRVDEIMYSSDPEWDISADRGKFSPIFEKVMAAVAQNPNAEWTPAYDVTSGLLVIAFIRDNCQVIRDGAVSKWFDFANGGKDCDVTQCVYKPGTLSLETLFGHLAMGADALFRIS